MFIQLPNRFAAFCLKNFSPVAPSKVSNTFVNGGDIGARGSTFPSFQRSPKVTEILNVFLVSHFPLCRHRVFWIVMFGIAVCLSCSMILDSYAKWDQTPVIISLSTKATPVWKVPFPAVTICPEVKSSSSKINLTDLVRIWQMHHSLTRYMMFQSNWMIQWHNVNGTRSMSIVQVYFDPF